MTLFQVEELTSYWAQHPPLHLLVEAYLGIGKQRHARLPPMSARPAQQPSSDAGALLAQLGSGFSAEDVQAGLSPVVLDFTELHRRARVSD